DGLHPARPGGLEVEAALGGLRDHRVDRELVAAGVDGDLVAAVGAGEDGVLDDRVLEDLALALVVDALLELADEARGEALEGHAALVELADDEEVLGARGDGAGLVDGDLDLAGAALRLLLRALVHLDPVGDGAAVLDDRLAEGAAFHADGDLLFEGEGLARVLLLPAFRG